MAGVDLRVPPRKTSRVVKCRTQQTQDGGALFLTQPEVTREGSILRLSTPSPPPDEDDLDQDVGNVRKPDVDEIKKRLYQRECTRLGVTPVGAFMREPTRSQLAIRHYSLGPRGAKALSVPLMLDSTLTSLDLEGNTIGADGMAEMVEMLCENCSITHLNLKRNKLCSRGASLVMRVLKSNRHIVSLNLAANQLVDIDGLTIADMLRETRTLKSLDLSDNALSFRSGKALGDVLSQNESLESLDLSWNQFRESGAVYLLQGVKENISLKTLTLAYNAFCRGACESPPDLLTPLLSNNTTLAHLDLSNNRLSDLDFLTLALGMKSNEGLKTLRVGQNLVSYTGTGGLVRSVLHNQTSGLCLLDMTDLPIGDTDIGDVEELQERGCDVIHGRVHQKETDFESEPIYTGGGEEGEEEVEEGAEETMGEMFPEASEEGGKEGENRRDKEGGKKGESGEIEEGGKVESQETEGESEGIEGELVDGEEERENNRRAPTVQGLGGDEEIDPTEAAVEGNSEVAHEDIQGGEVPKDTDDHSEGGKEEKDEVQGGGELEGKKRSERKERGGEEDTMVSSLALSDEEGDTTGGGEVEGREMTQSVV